MKRTTVFIWLVLAFVSSTAQSLRQRERQLVNFLERTEGHCCNEEGIILKDSFEYGLLDMLRQPGSQYHPFDQLLTMRESHGSGFAILYSPDSAFRIFSFFHHGMWDGPPSHHDYRSYGQLMASGTPFEILCDTFENRYWSKSNAYRIQALPEPHSYLLFSWGSNGEKIWNGDFPAHAQYVSVNGLTLQNGIAECLEVFPDSVSNRYLKPHGSCLVAHTPRIETLYIRYYPETQTLQLENHGIDREPLETPEIVCRMVWKDGRFVEVKD